MSVTNVGKNKGMRWKNPDKSEDGSSKATQQEKGEGSETAPPATGVGENENGTKWGLRPWGSDLVFEILNERDTGISPQSSKRHATVTHEIMKAWRGIRAENALWLLIPPCVGHGTAHGASHPAIWDSETWSNVKSSPSCVCHPLSRELSHCSRRLVLCAHTVSSHG